MSVLFTQGFVTIGTVLSSALCAACGPHPGVNSFTVLPELTCPGKPVVLEWKVTGPASLHAEPAPTNWAEGAVESQGTRTVIIAQDTSFTLTALKADPAQGNAKGTRPVKVSAPNDERGASAPCDPQTKLCRGSFVLNTAGSLSALKLTNPTLKQAGHAVPRDVCVTPPNAAKLCIAAGSSVPLASPVDGTWTLESRLSENEQLLPPPQLRITFDFGCPPERLP